MQRDREPTWRRPVVVVDIDPNIADLPAARAGIHQDRRRDARRERRREELVRCRPRVATPQMLRLVRDEDVPTVVDPDLLAERTVARPCARAKSTGRTSSHFHEPIVARGSPRDISADADQTCGNPARDREKMESRRWPMIRARRTGPCSRRRGVPAKLGGCGRCAVATRASLDAVTAACVRVRSARSPRRRGSTRACSSTGRRCGDSVGLRERGRDQGQLESGRGADRLPVVAVAAACQRRGRSQSAT
jgi:hypothetical protein